VLRHEVDYRRPLRLGETARARTWVAPRPDGPRYDRFVRIDGPDGAMCAQARTVWCLVDIRSRRPQRVPDWVAPLFA
jgi:acyl-CoA thioester hydrolase